MNDNAAPKPDLNKVELGGLIYDALASADELGLSHVAIHLNAALVALTGHGIEPPRSEDRLR